MNIRIDRAVINGFIINRMYSVIAKDNGIYLIHTGPGARLDMKGSGLVNRVAVNIAIKRALKKIEAGEKRLETEGLDQLSQGKHCLLLQYSEVTKAIFKEKGSFWNGRKAILILQTTKGKYKLQFVHSEPEKVKELADALQGHGIHFQS